MQDAGEGQFPITAGKGDLPHVVLTSVDGACADIYLHGAHVTSWRPAEMPDDWLYLSACSTFAAGAAIRGGIPISFPQFAGQGPLPNHGFARLLAWTLIRAGWRPDGSAHAVLHLDDSDETRRLWPHAFALDLAVTVSGRTLDVSLTVTNTGEAEFAFTAALHTYLDVRDVANTSVRGLAGAGFRDKARARDHCIEHADVLRIDGEIDRVYHCAPQPVEVASPGRSIALTATGFPDTVIWNPGPLRAKALSDLDPGSEAAMLCVEAAAASAPVVVAPGAQWRGAQTLTAG
jgi:glucose-6-phosphate 1-epimerase